MLVIPLLYGALYLWSNWRFTTASDARQGLRTGRHLMVIIVPPGFSGGLASGTTGTPRRAEVTMKVDDGNGYLIEIIGRTAKDQITQ